MAEKMPQTFANHTKLVPLFHYVVLPILSINVILAIYRTATGFSFETAWGAVVACALILIGFFARVFALGAQDRVIPSRGAPADARSPPGRSEATYQRLHDGPTGGASVRE